MNTFRPFTTEISPESGVNSAFAAVITSSCRIKKADNKIRNDFRTEYLV